VPRRVPMRRGDERRVRTVPRTVALRETTRRRRPIRGRIEDTRVRCPTIRAVAAKETARRARTRARTRARVRGQMV
jgi:hypothetical protein